MPITDAGFEETMRKVRGDQARADHAQRLAAQVALDRAAVHVMELDASEWCQWVGYLLEAIEALGSERGVHKLDMDAFMAQVGAMMVERLDAGRW